MVLLNQAFARYARDSWAKSLIDLLPPALSIRIMDLFFIPGLMHHYLFRKCFIEEQLIAAIEQGVRQVIVLGSGLDTLALRYAAKRPDIRFFEIDLPATQKAKIAALQQIAYPVPANCSLIMADLAQASLESVLTQYDRHSPTFVVLEGVLMFLTEAEVKSLFHNLRRLFTGPLTIVYGATIKSDAEGSWSVRLVNTLLGQEGMKWCCSSARMESFMASLGYRLKNWLSYSGLQSQHRQGMDLRKVPLEDENYYVVERS